MPLSRAGRRRSAAVPRRPG